MKIQYFYLIAKLTINICIWLYNYNTSYYKVTTGIFIINIKYKNLYNKSFYYNVYDNFYIFYNHNLYLKSANYPIYNDKLS